MAQAAGEEAKAAFRAQFDRLAAEMDFVRRDEFEAARAEIAALRDEIAILRGERSQEARPAQEAG
jgi:BMFP domain-containing protein YqiC